MQIKIIAIILLMVALVSCSDDTEPLVIDYGYDYFPLEIGLYREYDVTEINYQSLTSDTLTYQLRELVVDSIGTDEIVYLIERSKRATSGDIWMVDSIWSARKTVDYVVVTENNISFQKMKFPVQDSIEWDGNSFNTLDAEPYVMNLIASDTSATDILKVVISDIPRNLVLQDERSEFYFRGIGLIEKDYVSLKFCTKDCVEEDQIDGGRVLKQLLIAYGKE